MTTQDAAPVPRMSAAQRRALVLDAATQAFALGGYHGTSTDTVAKHAGVSQPYVVRIFGTKLELFLEVFERAMGRIDRAFAEVIGAGFDPGSDEDWERLGLAYAELMADRDLLMVMMHGFAAGGIEEIAERSRACMGAVFTTLHDAGGDEERIRDFVAQGMLMNVLLSMRAPEHLDEEGAGRAVAPFTVCAFGDALPFVIGPGEAS
ncbi:TetR/AcrR family transcriptional regulator [Nocardioides sp. AX2bis]|uniref:TetR/AcrR family transcriptional regulator n=1 Tax=Nocardioides sp. AX2bis TaxID=2653157 RepID=UPI0012F3692B|nr:TetR/AcrR family transcriptional regulator [Nocardioides sp. AX2bis]VXC16634.1 TetR family transcriptional regulator [Nocardioides sp. AX2bis]